MQQTQCYVDWLLSSVTHQSICTFNLRGVKYTSVVVIEATLLIVGTHADQQGIKHNSTTGVLPTVLTMVSKIRFPFIVRKLTYCYHICTMTVQSQVFIVQYSCLNSSPLKQQNSFSLKQDSQQLEHSPTCIDITDTITFTIIIITLTLWGMIVNL